MKLSFIARVATITALSGCFIVGLPGCGSKASQEEEPKVEQATDEPADDRATFESDGLSLKYDSSWENFGAALAPDGKDAKVYMQIYADGRTSSIDALAQTRGTDSDFGHTQDFKIINSWTIDGGTSVIHYDYTRDSGELISYVLGNNEEAGCGFLVSCIRGNADDPDIDDQTFNSLIKSIEYDPSGSDHAKAQKEAEEERAEIGAEAVGDNTANAPKTSAQASAKGKAKSYLNIMPFSKKGLVGQLTFDGFAKEDAEWGVEHCGADWSEQATRMATAHVGNNTYTHDELIDQLLSDGFTQEQAEHGVQSVGL